MGHQTVSVSVVKPNTYASTLKYKLLKMLQLLYGISFLTLLNVFSPSSSGVQAIKLNYVATVGVIGAQL